MGYFLSILITLAIVLFSMVLHELAHGVTAYILGDNTAKDRGRLTLNPFKHLDPILSIAMPLILALTGGPIFGGAKPVPVNSGRLKFGDFGMALVALAGPLMNILIAFIAYFMMARGWVAFDGIASQVMWVNMGFAIFNIIPIPPLDGSRILYAFVPDVIQNFLEKIEPYGLGIVLVIVVVFSGPFNHFMVGAMNWVLQGFAFLA